LLDREGPVAGIAATAAHAGDDSIPDRERGDDAGERMRRRPLSSGRTTGEGIHRRGRHHAGRAVAADEAAVHRIAVVVVPRVAFAQSVAVHVLLRLRRFSRRRRVTRNPRAQGRIDGLETTPRGVYAGAVGYISFQDDMDTAIAIRTAVLKDGMAYVQVGAGIVHDSVPEAEWQETQNKARAVLRAAEMVQLGLDDAA